MEEVVASAKDRDNEEVMGTEVEALVGEGHTSAITGAATFEVEAEVLPLSMRTPRRHPMGGISRLTHREATTGVEISKERELPMRDSRDRTNHSPVTPFLPLAQAHSVMPVARVITMSLAVIS